MAKIHFNRKLTRKQARKRDRRLAVAIETENREYIEIFSQLTKVDHMKIHKRVRKETRRLVGINRVVSAVGLSLKYAKQLTDTIQV
jgi:hypothetical protein